MIEPGAVPRRITLPVMLAAGVAAGGALPSEAAGRAVPPPPALAAEHQAPSGGFAFRTPADWVVENTATEPETINANGGGLRVRFVHRAGEYGYDSLHGACMLERLAPPAETSPVVTYEYDYIGGPVGDRRALDSAFVVRYDNPIDGQKEWRQRNVTVVGGGHSLCAVSYAPVPLWKKSKETRALLDAILASVTFR